MTSNTQRPVTTEVEAISEMVQGYYGDIISPAWNEVLCTRTKMKGKDVKRTRPFAMFLLARIVFMYTKTAEFNQSGEIVGYRRKFNGDYWLPNWNELAEAFGCSTRTLKDELSFLKGLGLVTTKASRERLPSDGVKNIREFVIPVASKIQAITPRHGAAKPAPKKEVGNGVKERELGNGEESSPAPSEESSPAASEESSPAPAKASEESAPAEGKAEGKKEGAKPTKAERDAMFDLIAEVWSMDKDMQASMIGQFVTACLKKDPVPDRATLQYVRDWMTAFAFECRDAFKPLAVKTYWQQAMDDRKAHPNDTIEQLTAIKRAANAQGRYTANGRNERQGNRNAGQVDYSDPANRAAARQRAVAASA